ncbi:MAG: DUF2911 domain-containing protein [Holophagales bacterium]|nr:DUF2911 domain-containing protein [Holophagales bacterium]
MKGRAIWGALVPLDKPWRTGANAATTITFSDAVTVEGQKLAAGTYSIVTIPGKDEWTVIFNNDTKLWWETEYDAGKDALRVKAKPQAVGMVETLHIGFPSVGATKAVLAIEWEKVSVPVTIGVDVDGKLTKALGAVEASAWQSPLATARYYFEQAGNRPEGWKYLDKSIAANRNWANVSRKARFYAEEGKVAEAVKAGEEALVLAKADPAKPNVGAFEKTVGEWKAKVK